jgi:hypothetical protein
MSQISNGEHCGHNPNLKSMAVKHVDETNCAAAGNLVLLM